MHQNTLYLALTIWMYFFNFFYVCKVLTYTNFCNKSLRTESSGANLAVGIPAPESWHKSITLDTGERSFKRDKFHNTWLWSFVCSEDKGLSSWWIKRRTFVLMCRQGNCTKQLYTGKICAIYCAQRNKLTKSMFS